MNLVLIYYKRGKRENLKELVNAINEFDSLSDFLEHIQLVMDGGVNSNIDSVKNNDSSCSKRVRI